MLLVDEPDPGWAALVLQARVRALLPGTASADDVRSAVVVTHRGMLLLEPELAQELFSSNRKVVTPENIGEFLEELTPREIKVLRMMAEGLSNKEIAARLAISDHTVKFHISSILSKLGAATRTEAVTTGIRMGIILL